MGREREGSRRKGRGTGREGRTEGRGKDRRKEIMKLRYWVGERSWARRQRDTPPRGSGR